MTPLKKKRGRPKKTNTLTSSAKKDVEKTDKKAFASEKKKLATSPITTTSNKENKEYHFKDGSTCTVTYSGCKAKPIIIKYGK